MNNKKGKFLAILACVAIVIVAIFSSTFISIGAHHDCTGHDCSICASIHKSEDTARAVATSTLKLHSINILPAIVFIALLAVFQSYGTCPTLVSQKVRLDN